jgi:hypothetical protein
MFNGIVSGVGRIARVADLGAGGSCGKRPTIEATPCA